MSSSEGCEVADRIRERIEQEAIARLDGDGPVSVTASIGLATLPGSAANAEELFARADASLYEAKRSGKNRIVVAESTIPPVPKLGRRATDQPKVPAAPRRK